MDRISIAVLAVIVSFFILAIIYAILISKNKYYFWKYATLVPDRNGSWKPGEEPKKRYGTLSPQTELSVNRAIQRVKDLRNRVIIYDFSVDLEANTFKISFDDVELIDGGLRVYSADKTYTTFKEEVPEIKKEHVPVDVFLLKMEEPEEGIGKNQLGPYDEHAITWNSTDGSVQVITRFRQYTMEGCFTFELEIPKGLQETARKTVEMPCLEFPVFTNASNRSYVFTYAQVNFSEPRDEFKPTSAPILFYNQSLDTFIVSPLNNFLPAWNLPGKKDKTQIRMGLEGQIKELSPGFTHKVMLYAGAGIAQTFEQWGDKLLKYYEKTRHPRDADQVLKYLGYWTDAGAAYYYRTESDLNYGETLTLVQKEAQLLEIPYQYFQLDSWFYPKQDGGMMIWEASQERIPGGIAQLSKQLDVPLICHNRWFSANTIYKTQVKGWVTETHGKGNEEKTWAFPTNKEIWDILMENCVKWNCKTYEQDWLQSQWQFFDWLKEDTERGREWLKNMAEAANKRDITIQYCMTFPSFYLQAAEFPNVTQARCADDYNCRKAKRIYIPHFTQTSMLCWACGVWPWKDNFYSQPNSLESPTEHYSELELLNSVLSGGPVGPGDPVGSQNTHLLLQACREDGVLIKPDRPAFPIEHMFLPHNLPYIYSTYSEIDSLRYTYLMQVVIWSDKILTYGVTPEQLGLTEQFYAIYDYFEKSIEIASKDTLIGPKRPLGQNEHDYKVIVPLMRNGMAFVGLRDKVITGSNTVFSSIKEERGKLTITGTYCPETLFSVVAYCPYAPQEIKVNGETHDYQWGPHYKMLSITLQGDQNGGFVIEIE